jgi:hypothetical protein
MTLGEQALALHNGKGFGNMPEFRGECVSEHYYNIKGRLDLYLAIRNYQQAVVTVYRVRVGKLQHVSPANWPLELSTQKLVIR